jgi:uncharacterized protein
LPVTQFTPQAATLGGALIGIAAVILIAFNGRTAGVSGILGDLFPPYRNGGAVQSAAFLAGLIAAPLVASAATGTPVAQTVSSNLPVLAIAGALAGFGAVYGGGCTSGHGVCGLSRLSLRSVVATAIFMATAVATVFATRHLVGDF